MTESRLSYLFQGYFTKTATAVERDELMDLLLHAENDEQLKLLLMDAWEQCDGQNQPFNDIRGEQMLFNILQKGRTSQPAPVIAIRKRSTGWLRIAVAAAILFFMAAGVYLWLNPKQSVQPIAKTKPTTRDSSQVIAPGGNKAVLTLSDGSSIVLDSTQQGALTNQGNTDVMKVNTTTLAYNGGNENSRQVVYNTLSTPSGGQYQLILPDGTKVWLNASSSIHFPTVFKGKERRVTVTGETYFEVAKNAAMPFKINVKDAEVQVTGTHFNIMAYDDENTLNTTLLEGSVKIWKGSSNKVLIPGQQSRINQAGGIKVVDADIEEVMAWKNGWFQFEGYDIERVMRQISRWYNVDIVYEGKIPTGHFSGLVSRDNEISQVLKIMQAGGVRFKIAGRKVIILA